MLTQKRLKEKLSYCPECGVFTNLKTMTTTGYKEKDWGYLIIKCDLKNYKAHRLAWLYMYGSFPEHTIDHKNGIKDDNRIANLRDVTIHENTKNQTIRSTNKTGTVGISTTTYRSGRLKYNARIRDHLTGKEKYKRFDSKEEAINQRKQWEIELGYYDRDKAI